MCSLAELDKIAYFDISCYDSYIFIKGCSGEDYTGFFQTAGYIEQKITPVCDSEQYCIVNT